jgi:transcription elongation factor Elf1
MGVFEDVRIEDIEAAGIVEPLPCPCGNGDLVVRVTVGGGGTLIYNMMCKHCGRSGQDSHNDEWAVRHWNGYIREVQKLRQEAAAAMDEILLSGGSSDEQVQE